MELLVSGQASARDAAGSRLHQYALGDVVWPPGVREEELAAVVAEEPSKTMLLTSRRPGRGLGGQPAGACALSSIVTSSPRVSEPGTEDSPVAAASR